MYNDIVLQTMMPVVINKVWNKPLYPIIISGDADVLQSRRETGPGT